MTAKSTEKNKKPQTSRKKNTGSVSGVAKAVLYGTGGKEAGNVELPREVFGVSWNPSLVFQVVRSLQGNARRGTAHTKDRSEVRGGGRKPWRQKGTGRARHGSIRSPLWRGGGVTFGPRTEKNYSKKINKKMRLKALSVVLSRKASDGEIILTERFGFKEPKTKEAREILFSISKVKDFSDILSKKRNSALILLSDDDKAAKKSFSNFSNVKVLETRNLNVLDAVKYKYILISNAEDSLKQLAARFGVKEKKETKKPAKTPTKTAAKTEAKKASKKKVKKGKAKTETKTLPSSRKS